jgi:NAD-dependent SIR2 family protein deacetylase
VNEPGRRIDRALTGQTTSKGASYMPATMAPARVAVQRPHHPRRIGPVVPDPALAPLVDLLRGRRVTVLTGAGVSTESGIPDYRGPGARPRRSIQYDEFVRDPEVRRRYWARAAVGWPRLRDARPNAGHAALAALEARGALAGTITQNVDRLHRAAGSREVIELHGALHEVRCLACGAVEPRDDVQARLLALNPGFADAAGAAAPDGDAELPADLVARFTVAACPCGGDLKPDVVFFGEVVPRPRREAAQRLLRGGDALLVVGSSLAVFSGYRFVREAKEVGLPVAIVNLGPTRGDGEADVRVEGRTGEVLPALAAALGAA